MITKDVKKAIFALNSGDIVAIPTETVYGLAANAFSSKAVEKIFELKKRPSYNPLIVHIKSVDYLQEIAKNIPDNAVKLAEKFWPGPLTLVLKKKSIIPDIVTANKDTVAVRMPNHPVALELLNQLDFPLAAPSANPFGSISPTLAEHVDNYFKENLEIVLDGGPCEKGIESTIIGFDGDSPVLYRLGSISIEDIEKVVGTLEKLTLNDESPQAPGMLSRHYAPKTETLLTDDLKGLININKGKKIGLLIFKNYQAGVDRDSQEILSPSGDFKEASKNLYAAMHRLDKLGLDIIIAERLPDRGLGISINDRLQRAIKK